MFHQVAENFIKKRTIKESVKYDMWFELPTILAYMLITALFPITKDIERRENPTSIITGFALPGVKSMSMIEPISPMTKVKKTEPLSLTFLTLYSSY